jgi:hypothetical protein
MQTVPLYNNQKPTKKIPVVVNSQKLMLRKNIIQESMSPKQIANIISDRLISHIDKAFEKIKKTN